MLFNRDTLDFSTTRQKGFVINQYMCCIEETFYKSTYDELKTFFEKYKSIKKWMIFSDYALYDKKKCNDVITLSFVPYIIDFQELKEAINLLAPKDLKNTKKINKKFVRFLNDFPIINFSFVLSKNRKIDYAIDEREIFKMKIGQAIDMFKYWCETTPEEATHYQESIKNLNILMCELESKGCNLKIIRDIEILATLVSYIACQVVKIADIEKIGWFSDRDSLLTYNSKRVSLPLIVELVSAYYHVFCDKYGLEKKPTMLFGIANDVTNIPFYDAFIRIPDLIAGTIADFDTELNNHSHDKFLFVTESLLTNHEKQKIFHIVFSKEQGIHAKRWIFSPIELQHKPHR